MKRIGLLSLALATAVTVACNGNARTDSTAANDRDATVGTSGIAEHHNGSSGDRNFIADMMAAGDAEVQMGKLAEQRASSPDVKRFAAMMVADHTKAGAALKKVAAENNVHPDADKHDKYKDEIDKLSKLRGADFDREYMSAMVDSHKDAVNDLEARVDVKRTDTGSTADKVKGTFGTGKADAERSGNIKPEQANDHVEYSVNQWAAMTLPTVRHHLDQAQLLQDKLQNNQRVSTAEHAAPHVNDTRKGLNKAKY
jgi:putative membrane protein